VRSTTQRRAIARCALHDLFATGAHMERESGIASRRYAP
jgi:hypothetical protein